MLALASGCSEAHTAIFIPDTSGVYVAACDLEGEPSRERTLRFYDEAFSAIFVEDECIVAITWDGAGTFVVTPELVETECLLDATGGAGEVHGDDLVLDLELADGRVLHCEGSR
jgi:hypothetical protein